MEQFIKEFTDNHGELAKELMEMVEREISKQVEWDIEWWGEKEWGFFNEGEQIELKSRIKKAIWKEIMIDLKDYGL